LELNLPDYITTEEAAEILGYHPESVRDLIRAGKLRADKKGGAWWIYRESVQEYKTEVADKETRGRPKQL
jgi:excisionase family DNA binding protein